MGLYKTPDPYYFDHFYALLQVGVLNFNPYFRQKGDNDHFYITKHYCSEVTELSFPEDILAAEYDSSNDVRTCN